MRRNFLRRRDQLGLCACVQWQDPCGRPTPCLRQAAEKNIPCRPRRNAEVGSWFPNTCLEPSFRRCPALERLLYPLHDLRAAPRLGLPEQAHGRVPGGIRTLCHPAPIAAVAKQQPYRCTQGSRQMCRHGVDRNDQIEAQHRAAVVVTSALLQSTGLGCFRGVHWPPLQGVRSAPRPSPSAAP